MLLLTARTDDESQVSALRQGAQDFLAKPFSASVLRARAERLLADRLRATRRLESSQQRLAGILRTARDAIVVCDADLRIVLFNPAAESIFGRSAAEVLGQPMNELFAVAGNPLAELVSRLDASGQPTHPAVVSGRALRRGGQVFSADCSVSRMVDAEGQVFCTLIVRDVTEQERARLSLERAHEQLSRVTQQFESVLLRRMEEHRAETARELHDAVGSAIAGVSLLVASASDQAGDERTRELLARAQEQLAVASRQVRVISRGMMPVGSDPGALLNALEQYAQQLSTTSSVSCNLRARGEWTDLPADAGTHLFRIVQEATTNSLRHGRATVLHIRLVRVGGCRRLVVLDNGTGDGWRSAAEAHAGIGLRSMQARARALGGQLVLEPAPGGGCRLWMQWTEPQPQRPA